MLKQGIMTLPIYLTDSVFIILYSAFIVLTLVLMVFYWGFFSNVAFYKPKRRNTALPAVSIVICAKNEYEKLKKYLPAVLDQDYPEYEVVVVNDASDDNSHELLTEYAMAHKKLQVVHIEKDLNFFKGKKFPLSIGIKSAKNEILLLTDADCQPRSNQWIRSIAQAYDHQTEVVIGYSPYKLKRTLLNMLIRFDTLHIALQYLSFAKAGIPYMGVGRNLSYKKSLFYQQKGFISHYAIHSGDDDLFINQVARRKNTSVVMEPDSQTVSDPKKTFRSWFRQKKRHLSTAGHYRFRYKLLLSLYQFSLMFFYLGFAALLIFYQNIEMLLPLLISKVLSQLVLFKLSMKKLGEKELLLFSPIAEVLILIINPILTLSNIIFKQHTWE